MNGEGSVPVKAMENPKEAARLVRAVQNKLWSAGKIDHNYRNLTPTAWALRAGLA